MPSYLKQVMSYRGRRRNTRRRMALQPIQSYKQITVDGPASRAAATVIKHTFLEGVDNYTGPDATNKQVPTGAKVMSVLLMLAFTNLVSVSSLLHLNVQCQRLGIASITPGVVGGSKQRNTVIFTQMVFLGKDQNNNFMFRIKIPPIYQRIREADTWQIAYSTDTVFASATQVIYKFYR